MKLRKFLQMINSLEISNWQYLPISVIFLFVLVFFVAGPEKYFVKYYLYKYKVYKKVLTKVGCCLLTESTDIPKESDDLLNDTPTPSRSPRAEMAMRWVHMSFFNVVTP